jgi:hypothetical protein
VTTTRRVDYRTVEVTLDADVDGGDADRPLRA